MSTIQAANTWKQLPTCRVVSISNQIGVYSCPIPSGVGATFTYSSNGSLIIDGINLQLNDLILFTSQTLKYQNGIWQITTLGNSSYPAILTRPGFYQTIEQIKGGQYAMIAAGNIYSGKTFVMVEPFPYGIGVPSNVGNNDINFNDGIDLNNLTVNSLTVNGPLTLGDGLGSFIDNVNLVPQETLYSVSPNDSVIDIDTTNNSTIVGLPASPVKGRTLKIIDGKQNASNNNISVNANGNNINGLNYKNITAGTVVTGNSALAINTTPDGNYVYVTNGGNSTISIIENAATSNPDFLTNLNVASNPVAISFTPNSAYAYIVCKASSGLIKVVHNANTSSPSILTTLTVGSNPSAIAIVPAGTYAFVPNSTGGFVSVLQNVSTDTPSNLLSITVGSNPLDVKVTPNGNYAYVANNSSNSISVIQNASSSSPSLLTTINLGSGTNPINIAISPNGNYAYVANNGNGTLTVIQNASTNSPSILKTIVIDSTNSNPVFVAFTSDGSNVLVADKTTNLVAVIQNASTSNPTLLTTLSVGTNPICINVTSDGTTAYVTNYGSGNVSIIQGANSITPSVSSTITTNTGSISATLNPNINQLFVANSIANTVTVIFNPNNPYPIITSNGGSSNIIFDGNQWITASNSPLVPFQQINSFVVQTGSPSVTFNNIPQIFNHLKLVMFGRTDEAAVNSSIRIVFNGDSGMNYYMEIIDASSTSSSVPSVYSNLPSCFCGIWPAGSATSKFSGSSIVEIPCYTNSTFYKSGSTIGSSATDVGTNSVCTTTTWSWKNSNPITSITISSSAPNFIAFSSFYLYGII